MNLVSELRADALSARALPALSVGVIIGLVQILGGVSIGALVFSGPLAPFLPQGIGLLLFGTFALCLVIALTGGYRGAISNYPMASVVVLGAIGAAITLEGSALLMTLVAIVIISAVTVAACFLLIGHLRLANLIRFVPYPVAGGVLAGTGGSCVLIALSMMGLAPDSHTLPSLLEPVVLWSWGPGTAYGLGLFIVLKRWNNLLILPASFAFAAALYHASLPFAGISGEEAKAAGLLFAGMSEGGLWPAFQPRDLAHVDWTAVALQIPSMLALVLVTLLCAVIKLSSFELAASRELDWNLEFRAAGRASVIAGLGGGLAGCMSLQASIFNHNFGAEARLTGVVAALVVGSVLLMGGALLKLLPVPLLAGMLLFFGVSMLEEWLLRSRKRLPRTDYAILALIFVTIIFLGFPEGLGIGMAITTVLFAVRLGRVDSVEAEFTARERPSHRTRSIADRAILLAEGGRVRAYRLRGYIFFGSAYAVVVRLKQSLGGDAPPACVLLDFGAVSGVDFSTVNTLCGFIRAAHDAGVRVALSAAPENCRVGLERNLPAPVYAGLLFEADADHAMERCEDLVIAARRSGLRKEEGAGDAVLEHFSGDIEGHLDRRILFEDMAHELRGWLEVRDYEAGESLVAMGARQEGLQLLLMGRASEYDAGGARLRQCGPGDATEPRGAFGAHVATTAVIADEPCRTLMLTPAVRRRLEENERQLMLELYGYLLTDDPRAGRQEI
ncbi:MAG: SulP family inorganic anion transporter [Gammaproteobacteria bacterium]|nr:SulP family inorganic anion transporter [Gammaproteobacteria bacterium]